MKRTQAMSLARETYPVLYRRVQRAGINEYENAVSKMRMLKGAEQPAATKFLMLVDRHILKNGGARTDAMRAVRTAYPREFEALQG
jgi:hypothetical protein